MAHRTLKNGYSSLVERLNRFPQGAPPSELLTKILKILFREREAELVSQLPIKPFTARKAARIWKMKTAEARKVLDELASRAVLVDIDRNGESMYILPPPMAGFFEFALMRVRDDIDQQLLSELYYQYLNVEQDFVKALFATGETQLGRTFINESALNGGNGAKHAAVHDGAPDAGAGDDVLHVLDYERASEVIRTAKHMAVGMCYCRHKKEHVGEACAAPMDICMTFNTTANSLIKHGHARRVDATEGLDLLHQAYDSELVQFGENVRHGVSFICNCCGCCCEALTAARTFAVLNPIHTTNFLPEVDTADCKGCGKCVNTCPVEAMLLVSANDPAKPKRRSARLDEMRCLGCGLCARACPKDNVRMVPRPQRVPTPVNGVHRTLRMAIERGTLQHLIFDNRALWSHRALAAILGGILKLSPVKQAMASEQVKSRYLERLIARAGRA